MPISHVDLERLVDAIVDHDGYCTHIDPQPPPPQDLSIHELRQNGADFLRRFMGCNHTVTEDYHPADHPQTTPNYWVPRRYGQRQCRRPVFQTALSTRDMASILALVEPVAEDILFLGITTVVRCVLADLIATRPGVHAHYELCKARMHELDYCLPQKNRLLTREMRRRAAELLTSYVDMQPLQRAAIKDLFYPLGKRRLVTPLSVHEVVALFDELDLILGPRLTEEIFLLGSATAVRNVIFRLQSKNPQPLGSQRRTRLETYYRMLSDIIHARQTHSENCFFHGPLFKARFDTVRWEVINLALAYLPCSQPAPPPGADAQ